MTSGSANDRLEGAFLELIEEKPYSKITVNHIVERAGVHRNTFYYHYQSIPKKLQRKECFCTHSMSLTKCVSKMRQRHNKKENYRADH